MAPAIRRPRALPALIRGVLAGLAVVGGATAGPGVSEINQVCALGTGCFPGDAPGWPVTIDHPGSYRLTGNLEVPDVDTDAIQVTTSDVTLDLGGFAILGPVNCSLLTGSCGRFSGSGTGTGVRANFADTHDITVRNGTVAGMGSTGVLLLGGGRIESVTARDNAFAGLQVARGVIARSVARENGVFGIGASDSVVVQTTAANNLGIGIRGGFGLLVVDSVMTANLGLGLELPSAEDGGGFRGCLLRRNNGGNANPQAVGGVQLGPNLCGGAPCP